MAEESGVYGLLHDLKGDLNETRKDIRATDQKVVEVLQRVSRMEGAIEGATGSIQSLQSEVNDLKARVSRLEKDATNPEVIRAVQASLGDVERKCPSEGCVAFHDLIRRNMAAEEARLKHGSKTGDTLFRIAQLLIPLIAVLTAWYLSSNTAKATPASEAPAKVEVVAPSVDEEPASVVFLGEGEGECKVCD